MCILCTSYAIQRELPAVRLPLSNLYVFLSTCGVMWCDVLCIRFYNVCMPQSNWLDVRQRVPHIWYLRTSLKEYRTYVCWSRILFIHIQITFLFQHCVGARATLNFNGWMCSPHNTLSHSFSLTVSLYLSLTHTF